MDSDPGPCPVCGEALTFADGNFVVPQVYCGWFHGERVKDGCRFESPTELLSVLQRNAAMAKAGEELESRMSRVESEAVNMPLRFYGALDQYRATAARWKEGGE